MMRGTFNSALGGCRRPVMSALGGAALLAGASVFVPVAQAKEGEPSMPYKVQTQVEGLHFPWSLAFLPDGGMLVTERTGQLRHITPEGMLVDKPIQGVPPVFVAGQAGLMDVALDPDFAQNQRIFLTHAYGTSSANNTRLISARLADDKLEDVQTVFSALPAKSGGAHYGGRIAFLPDKSLVLTLGDGFDFRERAQDPSNHLGSSVRVNRDGSVPPDNPFAGQDGVASEIFTLGHRNVQAIVYEPRYHKLYSAEHGPKGGDELNLLEPGKNYGWPVATHGVDYTGAKVSPHLDLPGLQPAVLYWTPSIAPSGMTVYWGDVFTAWRGDLFVSALAERSVRRIAMRDGVPTREQEVLFKELDARIRDVRTGPDGALYLLTDEEQGRVLRVGN